MAVTNEVTVGGDDVQRVFTLNSALDALNDATGPQVAILALADQQKSVAWCRSIRHATSERYIHLIVVCTHGAPQAAEVVSAGADDYVLFPHASGELALRIQAAKALAEQPLPDDRSRRTLESLASRDPLTGLLSRRRLLADLESAIKKSCITNEPVCCLLLDLDHFKRVNDMHGHLVGDEVLQRVGGVLQLATNGGDLVYRYGGDEFLLLMRRASLSEAIEAAEKIRSQIVFVGALMEQQPITISASVGAAQWSQAIDSPSQLLLQADAALMQAKRAGRDRTVASPVEEPSKRSV